MSPDDKERLWGILHAITKEEMDALQVSDSIKERGVTPDLIEQMRQAREAMGGRSED